MTPNIEDWLDSERRREAGEAEAHQWTRLADAARPVVRRVKRKRSMVEAYRRRAAIETMTLVLVTAISAGLIAWLVSGIITEINEVRLNFETIQTAVAW